MSQFSQKHYEAIAAVLKQIDSEWVTEYAREDIVEALVDLFELDNPKFNAALFRAACEK